MSGCLPALACEYPDEGNMPLRRAVAQVKYLPETEAWSKARGAGVLYLLDLRKTFTLENRCYWTLDAMTDGAVWQRFYVSPDGQSVLAQARNGAPVALAAWRARGFPAAAPHPATPRE
jgi:hypothetical protein